MISGSFSLEETRILYYEAPYLDPVADKTALAVKFVVAPCYYPPLPFPTEAYAVATDTASLLELTSPLLTALGPFPKDAVFS